MTNPKLIQSAIKLVIAFSLLEGISRQVSLQIRSRNVYESNLEINFGCWRADATRKFKCVVSHFMRSTYLLPSVHYHAEVKIAYLDEKFEPSHCSSPIRSLTFYLYAYYRWILFLLWISEGLDWTTSRLRRAHTLSDDKGFKFDLAAFGDQWSWLDFGVFLFPVAYSSPNSITKMRVSISQSSRVNWFCNHPLLEAARQLAGQPPPKSSVSSPWTRPSNAIKLPRL